MSLTYRPAAAQDLVTAEALVVASINDLTERHGFGPMATASPPQFQLFSLQEDPDGLWVAEDGGSIIGFAWSWVCGEVWFLAQLFVDPLQQGRGIGNELLKLTLNHARKSGAVHRALITFTFNRVSQGLYIRHGLFPRMPIYFVGAARERVTPALPVSILRSIAIDDTAAHMRTLAEIDVPAVGAARESITAICCKIRRPRVSCFAPAANASAIPISVQPAMSAPWLSRGPMFSVRPSPPP
jgi:ribosomal protein S18 acetylase RimI-like enzyme